MESYVMVLVVGFIITKQNLSQSREEGTGLNSAPVELLQTCFSLIMRKSFRRMVNVLQEFCLIRG